MVNNETTEYLRIDEKENAIDSLGRALAFLSEAEQNPFNWKWFTIALHNAAYSFMLLALQNTDLSGIWQEEPKIREKNGLIDIFNPKNKPISFMGVFERIQDPERMGGYINSKAFPAKPYHKDLMKHLKDCLRNEFIHFRPKGWSVHKKYIVEISLPVLEVVKFLAFESGRVRFFEDSQIKRTKTYLDALQVILKNYET
ncbi:MAG: hypothetical protein XE08_0048 [Parcubacteria bacterium 32_520]|nr:MAG: hypothetical protein XE08_0048 [Parcubacteria bacterium 32_520]